VPFMLPDKPMEDGSALSEPFERADLISAHEAAVALNIRAVGVLR
jgi:hypothetical protein